MPDRTKIYIAADGDRDGEAINQLCKWNAQPEWGLDLFLSHEMIEDHDTAAPCAVKASLQAALDESALFVLLVGEHTQERMTGSCRSCSNYGGWSHCARGGKTDERGYIPYACDKALEAGMRTLVLYASDYVNQELCPPALREKAVHLPLHADAVRKALDKR